MVGVLLDRVVPEPKAQKEKKVEQPKTPPKASGAKNVPPHKRQKKEESGPVPEPKTPPREPEPKASKKYVPPHFRAKAGGSAPSSAQAPAYSVSKASRSVLLGEMLSARVARKEDLVKALDDLPEGDPAREATATELQELEVVIKSIKEEQSSTRRGEKAGHSSRQERDKETMGCRRAPD